MDQATQILDYMKRGRSIDPMVALRMFSCFRLAARIKEIKDAGHTVTKEMVKTRDDKRYARYTLA